MSPNRDQLVIFLKIFWKSWILGVRSTLSEVASGLSTQDIALGFDSYFERMRRQRAWRLGGRFLNYLAFE